MSEINVVWHETAQGGIHGRSGYGCCILMNEMFDANGCEHWSGWENLPGDADGAVVVIHGGNERGDVVIERINAEVARLRWCIFIIIGDEDSGFPIKLLSHPNSRIWKQSPKPGVTKADRYPIVGYPVDCKPMIPNCSTDKHMNWFFAGQMTHPRRWELGTVLSKLDYPPCLFHPTMGYAKGLDHQSYYCLMSQTRVVPCPSGPETPDTHRMAETLECKTIPVLDAYSPNGIRGFWDMVLPGHPFYVVEDWATFPEVLGKILNNYDDEQERAQHFWNKYKLDFNGWLKEDLLLLRGVL